MVALILALALLQDADVDALKARYAAEKELPTAQRALTIAGT